LPADNGQPDSIAAAIAEVSESLTKLVQDEIELAKAEVIQKASALARGAAAVAAGAVFGVFAVIFVLLTAAWALDGLLVSGTGKVWLGFLIVLGVLLVLTLGAFLFAWKKLKVGAPTPKMAIDEAKKIRETVTTSTSKAG
jgi:protein-S-isoprenylcysteine O-methyltransferase Ste14